MFSLFFELKSIGRLSLANDNDKLLERYICTLPKEPNQAWWNMTDAYDSRLWDIDPVCQVAAICDNDTVVLDGARGATIEWSNFDSIWFATGPSLKRYIASFFIRFGWTFLLFGVLLGYFYLKLLLEAMETDRQEKERQEEESQQMAIWGVGIYKRGNQDNETKQDYIKGTFSWLLGLGVACLVIWLTTVLINPFLVRTKLAGKIRNIQGAFYGVEGYLNPETVESILFGVNLGRFKWSAHGSLLSRSMINVHKEKIGIDPRLDVDTRRKIEAAKLARPGDMRVSSDWLVRWRQITVLT